MALTDTHIVNRLVQALESMLGSGRRSNTVEVRNDRGQMDVYPVQYDEVDGLLKVSVERVPIDVTVHVRRYVDGSPIATRYGMEVPGLEQYVPLGHFSPQQV